MIRKINMTFWVLFAILNLYKEEYIISLMFIVLLLKDLYVISLEKKIKRIEDETICKAE